MIWNTKYIFHKKAQSYCHEPQRCFSFIFFQTNSIEAEIVCWLVFVHVGQQNWSQQTDSNSVISPAEVIPTSQQPHTVKPQSCTHSDLLRVAARATAAESLCPCLQSGSLCPHFYWFRPAFLNLYILLKVNQIILVKVV